MPDAQIFCPVSCTSWVTFACQTRRHFRCSTEDSMIWLRCLSMDFTPNTHFPCLHNCMPQPSPEAPKRSLHTTWLQVLRVVPARTILLLLFLTRDTPQHCATLRNHTRPRILQSIWKDRRIKYDSTCIGFSVNRILDSSWLTAVYGNECTVHLRICV